jgi:hypothetical protein
LRKNIWVEFTDGKRTRGFNLVLQAELRPDVAIEPTALKFVRRALEERLTQTLVIHRDMLDAAAFEGLRGVSSAPYYRIREISRTRDALELEIELRSAEAPACPRSIELHYQKADQPKIRSIPVTATKPRDGIAIVPSSYFISVHRHVDDADLTRLTARSLRLVSSVDRRVVITHVEPKPDDCACPFAWLVPRNERHTLNLWVKRLPQEDGVVSTKLTIRFRDLDQGTSGHTTINAYLLTMPNNETREWHERPIGNGR